MKWLSLIAIILSFISILLNIKMLTEDYVMKLSWYIKQQNNKELQIDSNGKLCITFIFNKWWIRYQYVRIFFQMLYERIKL